ncbi:PREDICTED: ATP-dependent DNA helicase PIF1-like [Camelina sativa]|uniref:ATP-dependent DNA helicase n=1 Tax=Camelina sativa TaxID=90675 RepID=A0ABM0URK9_CAMSA|nr:PREDICTED: ATP-dependent DNA helicase PIF1-like [Camelina sativa]
MPQLQNENITVLNQLIADEWRFINQADFKKNHLEWLNRLTEEQKKIYDEIINSVFKDKCGVFFLYSFGGTGKTFLWKVLSAAVRIRGEIVFNTASSGIASLLLEGGRTAHSRFGIPLEVHDTSMCRMSRSSDLGELVQEAKLIIWDEAPMMSKYCFETLDRSLKDIMRDPEDKPFGGKVIIFCGDFRQILHVIVGAGREQIVNSSLNSSYLWNQCKVLRLTRNMRLLQKITPNEAREIEEFSKWILDVGEGRLNEPNDGVVDIDIPEELLITEVNSPIESIINAVYGNSLHTPKDSSYFQSRAILFPTNDDVNTINDHMISILEGEESVYLSSDSIDPADKRNKDNPAYNLDFLNSVRISGVPNHALRLKIGCPIMLLRNIDAHGGLMNGTRLQITQIADHVIQARIITDTCLPFKMRRKQFPINIAFAMTINKSQGQYLSNVGLYLPRPVFSHGQLYVVMSRVSSKSGLKILITDPKGKPEKKTRNVVFKEVFQNI